MAVIREERDPRFWADIANDPGVASGAILSSDLDDLGRMVRDPLVLPWASDLGGFLFFQRDALGRIYELHTLFRPQAWGSRLLVEAAKEAFEALFLRGADLVFTVEVATNARSRPPLSHGWRPAGPFRPATELAADVRTWVLTQETWEASPARRRFCRSFPSSH